MDQHKEINWEAPEYKFRHKDASWYWISIIIGLLLVLVSLWQKNLLFALFIIVAEIMIIVWAKEIPKTRHFKLNNHGIHISTDKHTAIKSVEYENIKGFHIREEDHNGELILITKNRLHPYLKILVAKRSVPEIKEYLKKYVIEVEYEESLSDHIEKIIKF